MVASEQHLYQTIVLPRKLATGSIHDYLFCYCPLVGILFEVLRIKKIINKYPSFTKCTYQDDLCSFSFLFGWINNIYPYSELHRRVDHISQMFHIRCDYYIHYNSIE